MLMPLYCNGTYHVRSTIPYSLLFSPSFSQNPDKVMQVEPFTDPRALTLWIIQFITFSRAGKYSVT